MSSGNIRVVFTVALVGFVIGFDAMVGGYLFSHLHDALLTQHGAWDANTWIWVTIASTFAAAASVGVLGDRLGARGVLGIAAGLFVISALGVAMSWSSGSYRVFQLLGSVAASAAVVAAPVLLTDIAPTARRGAYVGWFALGVPLGTLLGAAYCIVASLTVGIDQWRWLQGGAALPAVLLLVLMMQMRAGTAGQIPRDESGHLFVARHRASIVLALTLAVMGALMGGVITLKLHFDALHVLDVPMNWSWLLPAAHALLNAIAMTLVVLVVDRAGRKPLLMAAAVGAAVCLMVLAFIGGTRAGREYLLAVMLVLGMFTAISRESVTLIYTSEIFPAAVRLRGRALVEASGQALFIVVLVGSQWIGADEWMLVFFALCMLVSFFVIRKNFPETRGVALEDMGAALKRSR